MTAFETDIINLLIGPLAEAKHVADIDDEIFNRQLIDLKALKNSITRLANYILDSNKNIISCEEVVSLLEH